MFGTLGGVSDARLGTWDEFDAEMDLVRRSGLVLRVGRASLASGAGSYRVKASMAHVARALGIERHQALVTLTEITTTSYRARTFRTEVTESREVGVNADRLTRLQLLVSDITGKRIEPDDLDARLTEIEKRPPLYPSWMSGLWAGIACGGFAYLLGEGMLAVLAAGLGAACGQTTRRLLHHRRFNQLGVTMLAAAVASLVYLGATAVFGYLGISGQDNQAGYIASVLFLVPGFPLVSAALDLARLDLSAGLTRLTYALTIITSAAVVVWGISHTFGAVPEPPQPDAVTASLALRGAQLFASFCGVLGFALMFNSPWRTAGVAAGLACAPNLARIMLVDGGVPAAVAATVAALIVGVLAAWVGPRLKVPRITLSVPGVVIMVPGTTTYLAMAGMGDGATSQALAYAVQAAIVVLGISIGLALARMLTDPQWAFDR